MMKNKYFILGTVLFLGLISLQNVNAALNDSIDNYYKFDNTTGNVYSSVDARVLTQQGTVNSDIGKIGTSRGNFSNVNLFLGDKWAYDMNYDFSINFWIKPNTAFQNMTNDQNMFLSSGTGTSGVCYIHFAYYASNGQMRFGISKYGIALNEAYFSIVPNATQWYMVTGTYNATSRNMKIYVNGIEGVVKNYDDADCSVITTASKVGWDYNFANKINVSFDEMGLWNKTLTDTEILSLSWFGNNNISYPFTNTTPTTFINNLSFLSQSPTNITSTTLFNQVANITYKYQNDSTTLSNITLNYSISGSFSCIQYINGTCILNNNTFRTKAYDTKTSTLNITNATFSIMENDLYPSINSLNYTYFNQTHNSYTALNNDVIKTKFVGFNTTIAQFLYFETMTNVSVGGLARVYVCNSTYTTGSLATDTNCVEVGSINNQTYNHTHNTFSSHNIVPFNIDANGKVNGVINATNTMYIAIAQVSGTIYNWYVANTTNTTTTQTSGNSGVTWSTQTYTLDSHVHFYSQSNNMYLNYQGVGTFNSTITKSSFSNELIDLTPFAPSPPIITNPLNTTQSTRYINITYLNATSNFPNINISYYNISLLNNNLSFNRTIIANNGKNNSYNYDLYSQNLSITTYYVEVCAYDTSLLKSCDQETFNLTRNSLINVTMFNATNPLSNFSINVTDLTINVSTVYNTTGTYIIVDTIKNRTYNIFALPPLEFAYTSINRTINDSFNTQVFAVVSTNSVDITIRDEDTLATINQNTSIRFIKQGSALEYNYVSTNGTYFVYGLVAGIYDITFTSPTPITYSTRTYTVTVNDRTTQTLNAFLVQGSFEAGFYIRSEVGSVIEGATFAVQRLVNGSYVNVDSGLTDILGYTVFTLKNGNEYKFVISHPDYDTREFLFTPYVINSPYTFVLTQGATNPYFSIFDHLSYLISPTSLIINESLNTFSLSVLSIDGAINYVSTVCDNQSSNVTGSPVSATASVIINTTNYYKQTVNCNFSFEYDSGIGNYSPVVYSYTRIYTIPSIPASGESVKDNLDDARDRIGNVGWTSILAYLLIIVGAGLVSSWSDNNRYATAGAVAVLVILFASIGWINPLIGGVVGFIGLMLLFMGGNR